MNYNFELILKMLIGRQIQSAVIELSKKYVQKKKLRANLLKTKITTSQGTKGVL
jgi:hypothetical protein